MRSTFRRGLTRFLSLAAGLPAFLAGCGLAAQSAPVAGAPADPIELLHPELRLLPAPTGTGEATVAELVATLRNAGWSRGPRLARPEVVERTVQGRDGAPDVRVLVVNAEHGAVRPGILHIHGGGYVSGTPEIDISFLQAQAEALQSVIVSVGYRLAPETPFPGSLEDNYAALKWMYDSAQELGLDRTRIALQGMSAGGGHAAMLAIAVRDRGEVPVIFQALVYPMLDDRTGSTRQVPAHIGTYLWTPGRNRLGWAALLGQPPGGPSVPAGAVPARVESVSGLPAAWIGVGSLDLFVQENIEYAQRLVEAGVSTELHVVPGAYHAFEVVVPNASISRQFVLAHLNALARAFGREPLDKASVPADHPMR
jgi:acetyl esterase/lipase